MNICILNHGLASGGTDSFVLNLARGLIQDEHAVTIALAVDPESGKQFREDEARELGAAVVKLSDLGSIRNVLRYALRLYRFLRASHFDVFHANMDLFNGLNMFAAWLARVPVRVCHSHNSQSQYEEKSKRHTLVSIYRKIMRNMLWMFSTDRCGCSKPAMDYLFLKRWETDARSHLVYNGIDLNRFLVVDSANCDVISSVESPKTLITVGRIEHQKNPYFTVSVMKELLIIDPDYKLIWVGTGNMRAEIVQKIQCLQLESAIQLLGTRTDIPELLHQASTFLFPSFFEGLPISLIEAQAAGLTCIVSDTITRDINIGLCEFMSLKLSPKQWAEKIIELNTICRKVDNKKLQQFSIESMVKRLEKIYESHRLKQIVS